MKKTKYTRKKKKNKLALYLLILIIPIAYYFIFHLNKDEITTEDATEYLVGSWQRTEGNYIIKIDKVKEDGLLDAAYFNPGPINVGRAGWRVHEKILQIYVVLDDVNYPGSTYELSYNKETKMLDGTYYQATMKQTYQISFKKK